MRLAKDKNHVLFNETRVNNLRKVHGERACVEIKTEIKKRKESEVEVGEQRFTDLYILDAAIHLINVVSLWGFMEAAILENKL